MDAHDVDHRLIQSFIE